MATGVYKSCDVYPTCLDVVRFRVTLVPIDNVGDVIEGYAGFPLVWEHDLSKQAVNRLKHQIDRGVNPIGWSPPKPPKKPKAAPSETPTEPVYDEAVYDEAVEPTDPFPNPEPA